MPRGDELHSEGGCSLKGSTGESERSQWNCSQLHHSSLWLSSTYSRDWWWNHREKAPFGNHRDLREKSEMGKGECSFLLRLLLPSMVGCRPSRTLGTCLLITIFFFTENFILRTNPSRVESMFLVQFCENREWKWALKRRWCCGYVWSCSGCLRQPFGGIAFTLLAVIKCSV